MKFKFKILVVFTLTLVLLAGCRKADRISHNISREAAGMKGIDTKYRIYFNPDMVIPIDVKSAD